MATVASVGAGCVADRPSRNGVFNENQYLKKSFLIEPGDGTAKDPGWFLKSTVVSVSTPNPIGPLGIAPGYDGGTQFVRFRVTQDKLQMVNVRELENNNSVSRTEEVLNAWPVTNVDLKYRINLDGEKTNFYEENQELDWATRQWVKVSWAKNDMSDVAPLGVGVSTGLAKCTDLASASATLVTDSFKVEENSDINKNYMQWTINITVPVKYDDPACVQAYGGEAYIAGNFGRQNVSFNLMYSLMRAKPVDDANAADAYIPIELDEKDPIRHKYGVFNIIPMARDKDTRLLAARQLVNRFNPNKPITYYFSPGVPDYIKDSFNRPGGIADLTNAMFEKAGAKARAKFINWNDDQTIADAKGPVRDYGDIRYNFVRWVDDIDANQGYLGLGPNSADPRTGEILSATVNLANAVNSELAYQIDFYLKTLGSSYGLDYVDPKTGQPADWPDLGACKDGDVAPLKTATVQANHNGHSSLYAKMQQYLQKPQSTYGNLGAQDFVAKQDADFFKAYYTILPYQMFADPDVNPFVIREGGAGIYGPTAFWSMMEKEAEFQKIAASIDRGESPFEGVTGPEGLKNATAFGNHFRDLTINHKRLDYAKQYMFRQQFWDAPSAFNLVQIMNHAGRHCIGGKWETKDEWVTHLIHSFYDHISIHEFGHNLGLQHNFMGSVDKPNWPVKIDPATNKPAKDAAGNPIYTLYTSSQMEYNVRGADMMNTLQWGAYDLGALGWTYSNGRTKDDKLPTLASDAVPTPRGDSISGQSSSDPKFKTAPWNDPYGFDAKGVETQFLYCHHEHLTYTPLCRTFDAGSTPSEIIANAIDGYEWEFNFTNYRAYRKFWNGSQYATRPANLMIEMRRFMSLWLFDWGASELADTFRRVGLKNPDPNGSDLQYFGQLTNKFNTELSYANKMVAAFHKAIIQQSSGERPVRTVYDKYYGDTTQQGIILDKLFAMQGFVALWPSDNYDPNQAGSYISSYSYAPDNSYAYSAEDAVDSMLGGQYDAFPYFAPLAVAMFSQDTHSPSFGGRVSVRNWIGGHVFYRLQDYLDFFRDLAVQNNLCSDIRSCNYDPRTVSDTHNEFLGPDKKQWIWAYIPNRNTWTAAQKDINTATYVIMRNYTDDVVYQLDDGAFPGGAYGYELPMKYYLDSFQTYN